MQSIRTYTVEITVTALDSGHPVDDGDISSHITKVGEHAKSSGATAARFEWDWEHTHTGEMDHAPYEVRYKIEER